MILEQEKWIEELGRFLLDVGKYVLTAVVIGSFWEGKSESWQWLTFAAIFTMAMVFTGLLLVKVANSNPKKKK